MTAAQAASASYPISDYFDEAFSPDGELRAAYRGLLDGLDSTGLAGIQGHVQSRLREDGVEFGPEGKRSAFVVDAVPRIITAAEWSILEAGLCQRIRALQMFLADIYSRQEIITAGIMRRSILDGAPHYEPVAAGFGTPVVADIAGPDLVRDESGFRVLEDNLRFPSGITFALVARRAVGTGWKTGLEPVEAESAFGLLGEMLRNRAPEGDGDPVIAILSEGPDSAAFFEHRTLATMLDIEVVTADQLEASGGELIAREGEERKRIDVLYNRSNTDRITRSGNDLTPLGALLIEPLRSGKLACVNSFGAGVADPARRNGVCAKASISARVVVPVKLLRIELSSRITPA